MKTRTEIDSLGKVKVPTNKLWGAQTARALEYFSIGDELMPREMIFSYAIIKKAAATANSQVGNLAKNKAALIIKVCNEILAGKHQEMFPVGAWISGSGTQFNMNINEVITNRASQLSKQSLGSKKPVHPNDDVNRSQSTNDTFPTAMHIAAALNVKQQLIPALKNLRDGLNAKTRAWKKIIKIGRTHWQDAVPLTLGQEFSGYVAMLEDNLQRIAHALKDVYRLPFGGTAIGTGTNAPKNFSSVAINQIVKLTKLPFIPATNKFAAQGSHDALVQLSATLKTLAVSLNKIADDIRFLSCGPRAGIAELILPANEPGSSIMPGKVNPTQCEALAMIALQVIANDVAVTLGGASGHLEMNVYKPLIITNLLRSIRLLTDGMNNFNKHLVAGMQPNKKQITYYLERSLMLVTALSPVIGYDKAAQVAHYALQNDLTLKDAALQLGLITSKEFDAIVKPSNMI